MIEMLTERLHTLQVIGAASEGDPLAEAYQAAEAAEYYAQAVRAAIARIKTHK